MNLAAIFSISVVTLRFILTIYSISWVKVAFVSGTYGNLGKLLSKSLSCSKLTVPNQDARTIGEL